MNTIETILQDLYKIDSKLKEKEPELRKLINELLLSRPDTKFDEEFARRLRAELMLVRPEPQKSPFAFLAAWGTFQYGLAGAALVAIFIMPLTYYSGKQSVQNALFNSGLSVEQKIDDRGTQAFGTITFNDNVANDSISGGKGGTPESIALSSPASDAATKQVGNHTALSSPAAPSGSATGVASPTATAQTMSIAPDAPVGTSGTSAGSTGSANVSSRSSMPAYYELIQYVYNGDLVPPEASAKVYKRVKNLDSQNQLSDLLSESNFGLADLKSFSPLKIENLQLFEDKPFGYQISVNFLESTISINPDWRKWGDTSSKGVCSTKGGCASRPVNNRAMPSNESLIARANSFLQEHGISTTHYAAPVVQTYPPVVNYDAAGKEYLTHQETALVIYPLVIDGLPVYEQNGVPFGLQVSINVFENRVGSVNNLNSQVYESASYALETDTGKIKEALKNYGGGYYAGNVRVKTLGLENPTRVLLRYWTYDQNQSQELYVPALLFKISNTPQNHYQDSIVIPIVKDFFTRGGGVGDVRPLPMPVGKPVSSPARPTVTPAPVEVKAQ